MCSHGQYVCCEVSLSLEPEALYGVPKTFLHRHAGKVENTERFLRVALYQGTANKKARMKVRVVACSRAARGGV